MAFDATAFKSKLSSSLGIQPAVPQAAPPPAALSFKAPSISAPVPQMKTATPALPSGTDTLGAVKKGIQLLDPRQKVTVRPAFNLPSETQQIYGGPVVGAAHDIAARTMEGLANIAYRTVANAAQVVNKGKPTELSVPFNPERIGMDSSNGNKITDTGTELTRKFDELENLNPGKTKTNIALSVIAGPVTDALNAFVAGDLLTGAAKSVLKATRFDPELNWALDTFGIRNSGLTGEDFTKELTRRFNKKATALATAGDTDGLDKLGNATHIIIQKITGRGVPQLSKLGTVLENAARTGLQDSKYGFRIQDPRFPEVAPEGPVRAAGEATLPGTREVPGQAPAFGMSIRKVEKVGGEYPESKPSPEQEPEPVEIHHASDGPIKFGETGAYFAPKDATDSGFGGKVEKRFISPSATVHELPEGSTEAYLSARGLLDEKNTNLKEKYGVDTLRELKDADLDNPNDYYLELQRKAIPLIKKETGADVIKLRGEDDLNPTQYVVQNKDALLTEGDVALAKEARKYKSADEFVESEPTIYHGTKSDLSAISKSEPISYGDPQALYGPGVYVTDTKDIAEGYSKTKGSGATGKILEGKINKGTKLLNLDEKLPDELVPLFDNELNAAKGDFEKGNETVKGMTGKEAIKTLRENLSEAQIPKYEAAEHFFNLHQNLAEEHGYDGFMHRGGVDKGKEHNVAILFDYGKADRKLPLKDLHTKATKDSNESSEPDLTYEPTEEESIMNSIESSAKQQENLQGALPVPPERGTKDLDQLNRILERTEKSLDAAKENPEAHAKAYGPERVDFYKKKIAETKARITAVKREKAVELKKSGKMSSEDESYQVLAEQHGQSEPYLKASKAEEEALTDNLTAVFKDMKGIDQETLDAHFTDEEIEQARQHYEFLQDALLDHPGRVLSKYVSPETGQLPEVRGTRTFNGEEIKGNRGIWATKGDAIFQDLVGQEFSKGGDLDFAQELVDQYRELRAQLADVQKSFRSMRKTIQNQKLKDKFVDASKRAIARQLAKDVATLKNLVQAAERSGFIKGVDAGNKKVLTIVNRIKSRRHQIIAIQKSNNLSDKQMKDATKNMDWRLVPPKEFESWLNTVQERAAIEHHKNVTRQIIAALIEDSSLKNPDNLRAAMDLPTLSKMDLAQLQEYENALSQFKKDDSFIGPRMMTTLENTDLSGARTWREIREKLAEQTGTDVNASADVRGGEFDKYTYDQALMEKNPLFKYMVSEFAAKDVENAQKLMNIDENLNKLAKAARASRSRTRVDKLVPQDKEVFGWLNTAEEDKPTYEKAKKMTPQELEYARYVQALYRGWRDILIEKNTLKKWREAYVTHSPRSFLERWLEDSKEEGAGKGFVKSVVGSWRQFTDAHVDFTAVGDTGQVLGLEKFFKYSLPRGKEVIPSKNVARVVMQYARTFYKKDTLDQIIPKVEAYTMAMQRAPGPGIPKDPTGLNVDGKLKEFVKQWLNNKKGRKLTFMVSQGGKVDVGLRIMNFVITMHDLGFNLIAQPTSAIGELMANFIAMEPKDFALGAQRFLTKEGREVASKYPGVVGEPPFERLISASNDASDTFMAGAYYIFQEVSYRARQQFFLGFLTPEELESGIVSPARQAEIKNFMGKYRPIEGTESLIGSTTEGKILGKYKTWAVPLLHSTMSDLKKAMTAFKAAAKGEEKVESAKEGRRLLRLAVGGLGTYLFFSTIFHNEDDQTPLGKLQYKILQELMSAYSAFDPRTWVQVRSYEFAKSVTADVAQLITLEKYTSNGPGYKKGDLKAPRSFVRDFAPAFIRQFSSPPESTSGASTGSTSTASKNPALKRLDALKKAKSKTNPALDRLKKLKEQSSASNPALRRLKSLKGS